MDLVSSKHIEEFIPGEILYHGAIQVTPFRNKEYIKKFSKNYELGTDSKLAQFLGYVDPNIEIKTQNFGIKTPDLISQGYLFNVGFGLSVHDISFNAIANLSYKNLRYGIPAYEGDILFARSGATVGKTYRYKKTHGFCIYAGYLIRYKPNPEIIIPDYLFYFTKTEFYKKWVMSKMKTVAQPNINAKQYGNELNIQVPPIELQHNFADLVQKVECLKEKQKQSETQLQILFNSLMQRAFRGDLV